MNPKDFKRPEGSIRVNRPSGGWEEENGGGQGASESMPSVGVARRSKGGWILLAAVIVVVLVLGMVYKDKLFTASKNEVSNSEYQAVFLTNGQVYFGKLTATDDRYVQLESIYYLQVTPVLQTKTEGQPGTQDPQQQLSLVKLGNELHAPVDRMKINRDQILFFEDLKADGKVVQAIKKYEEDQGQ